MTIRKKDIIDYFDNRRICCGLIVDLDGRRVRVLSEHGKETKISENRVLVAVHLPEFPWSAGKDGQLATLKEIAGEREKIKEALDLEEIWEVVGPETGEIGIEDLTDLVFGNERDTNSEAALLRAVSEDRIYFKIRPDRIEVASRERVERALTQRQKERERLDFIAGSAEFLSRVKGRNEIGADAAPEGFVPMLEEAALHGEDWVTFKTVKEIFSNAGAAPDLDPFRVLVRLGIWSEDENVRLRAEQVPVEFSPEVEALAVEATERPLPRIEEDLTREEIIAIDDTSTRDVDDALSFSRDGDDAVIGIHITDVARFVDHDSPLDLAIRERATSIYLPDLIIPMIPPVLSEEAASLSPGEIRPAVSMTVRLGPDRKTREFRIFLSLIRVGESLSYEEADQRISDGETKEAEMYAVASDLREHRIASGALVFRDPEPTVHLDDAGEIRIALRERDTPSQILVSEMMILANSLFARFLKEHDLAGIFRSQPPPNEKIDLGPDYDPVLSYRCRKTLIRGETGPDPAPHSTLGLDCYTTATSPLRRYPDLLVQRQIKSFLENGEPAFDRTEMEKIAAEISYPVERASVLERERQRFFLLKHLAQRKDEEFDAVVLQRFPRFHLVQIPEFCLNAALKTPNSLALSPYDRATVRIEKVNPREDRLSLSLVRLS